MITFAEIDLVLVHPTPYTLHPVPYTLHPTPCTLHPTPCTLRPTQYTLNLIPYTLHLTPETANSGLASFSSKGSKSASEMLSSPLQLSSLELRDTKIYAP